MVEVVTAIIKDDNGKILISKDRSLKERNIWSLPGEKIENGEADEEALTRGIKQNLNIEISVNDYIAEKSFQYDEKKLNLIAYDAKYEYGKLSEDKEYKWVSKSELENYNFTPSDQFIINKIKK